MKIKKIIFSALLPLCILFPVGVNAASATPQTVSCDQLSQSISNVLNKDVTGSLYLKLPKYLAVDTSTLSVYYSAPTIGADCTLIASVQANKDTWVKLGDNLNIPNGTSITIDGDGLNAEIYAASAYLLNVTNNACSPNFNCDIKDSFGTGYLDPYITTTDHDQIAIYRADPVSSLKPYQYNYYDNGILLYVSKTLSPFNKNYLAGGDRKIDIEAKYSNYENIHYTSKISMGADWSKWLLIRSTFYKLKTPAKIFALVILAIVLGLLGFAFYHFVIKKIQARHAHGMDNYQPPELPPQDPENNIFVG